MKAILHVICGLALIGLVRVGMADVLGTDSHVALSPYNWYRSDQGYLQTSNPGAYLRVGFTGTKISVKVDVSPLSAANVPASMYPIVRYSVDGGPPKTLQLSPSTASIPCATGLTSSTHTLLFQYVAGYVFLDFWTPVNVVRVAGFILDGGAVLNRVVAPHSMNALFLGDSITNGDDDLATFAGGITNGVDTQDGTVGYPSVVAAGIGEEYGVVAYGGASWDGTAADGHTPGLPSSFSMLDALHSRFVAGKLSPVPDDIFINMGENSGPSGSDVPKLLARLRHASGVKTRIFLIVPFSGRARESLSAGLTAYRQLAPSDSRTYLLDLGNCPYLTDAGSTMLSVDGQHPLATLHGLLGAQLVQARAVAIAGEKESKN